MTALAIDKLYVRSNAAAPISTWHENTTPSNTLAGFARGAASCKISNEHGNRRFPSPRLHGDRSILRYTDSVRPKEPRQGCPISGDGNHRTYAVPPHGFPQQRELA